MVNQLSAEKRAQIVSCLCEGMSIRATVRATGAAKNTIRKFLAEGGGTYASCVEILVKHGVPPAPDLVADLWQWKCGFSG